MNRHHALALRAAAVGIILTVAAVAGTTGAARAGSSAPDAAGPAAGVFSGRLYGVAAASAHDAWAVGLDQAGSLILHWNGTV